MARIERLANISLGLSIASLLCGAIVMSVVAYIIAAVAQRDARPFGKTSSDGRIRTAKTVAIVATALWAFIFLIIAINGGFQDS